jgi:repressor LexA
MSPRHSNQNLTTRQEEVLRYLCDILDGNGLPPSYREIGAHFGIRSTNGVKVVLDALERKGFIRRHGGRARGIEVLIQAGVEAKESQGVQVPLIGRVAAGEPILALEHVEDQLQVDPQFLRGDDNFALEVKGESMIEAGIFDGDIVFAQSQESAATGDMVVAIIDDEATVKFYFPEGEKVRLQPANERYEPILVHRQSGAFRIAGKVVGLMRRY